MRKNGIGWSKKQVPSLRDTETYPQALAFPLVRLEPGQMRVPWAGSEQTCLRGKGVTAGESPGAAPRLCQAGSHWHNWKSDSGAWLLMGSRLLLPGLCSCWAEGKVWGRSLWFLFRRVTVTPRGVGTALHPGAARSASGLLCSSGSLSCRFFLLPSAVASKRVKSECPAHVQPLASLPGVPTRLAQPPAGHTAHLLLHGALGV